MSYIYIRVINMHDGLDDVFRCLFIPRILSAMDIEPCIRFMTHDELCDKILEITKVLARFGHILMNTIEADQLQRGIHVCVFATCSLDMLE